MSIKVGDGVLAHSTDYRYFRYGIVIRESENKGLWVIRFCHDDEQTFNRQQTNFYRNAFKKMMKDVQ